jgi:hypothetical protein
MSSRHFLDRPVARICAVLVFALSAGALGYLHREDLMGGSEATRAAANDPLALCIAARTAQLDKMQQEGLLNPDQVERTRGQLEPVCRAQLKMGEAGGAPPQ